MLSSGFLYAQGGGMKGRVVDAETNEPLAYVNIIYNDRNQGVISDVDGYFTNFTLITNVGFGDLKNISDHLNINVNKTNKGYYESGLLLTMKEGIFEYGFGAYYRYGPYSFSDITENLAFKIDIKIYSLFNMLLM